MKLLFRLVVVALLSPALTSAVSGQARVPATDIARLDGDLTPVGAERAGNAAGTIPPWTGGMPQRAMEPAIGYVDPYADDEVLFTITADNADQIERIGP